MKKYYLLVFTTLLMWINVLAQPLVEDFFRSLNETNLEIAPKYFDKFVNITIDNNQSTYSKSQAEMVFKNFMSKKSAKSFQIKHKGNSNSDNSIFAIGELVTEKGGTYKVYFFLKQKSNQVLIQDLKLE